MMDEQIDSLMCERYLRLVELHGQLQNQNSFLEERILSIVETYTDEKRQFQEDLTEAKEEILHLKERINQLEMEKQRYKDDCQLAVRLLQQHPQKFLSETSEQLKSQHDSTPQHTVIIPTFPPTFIASFPLLDTTIASPLPTTMSNDYLRLAQLLLQSTSTDHYPFTHFICSKCHERTQCSDASVQTSLVSHTSDRTGISFEPHHHTHLTVTEYQRGSIKRLSHDPELSSSSLPQMHHV